jgi:nitroreductase/NAD-dependent dihydropyrimidine dehydrogenase PreA subunit
MKRLIIDKEKCKKDAICATECPISIISLAEDGFPEIVSEKETMCIACGHCVAVCPHGALSHDQVRLEDCPAIEKEWGINDKQAIQFLRSRRSIRFFKEEAPDKETIRRLIEIARYAPTASNAQPVEWTVLNDRIAIKEIAGITVDWLRATIKKSTIPVPPYMPAVAAAWDMGYDAVLREAPVVIVASAPKEDASGMTDVTLALSYLELAAPVLGLGTCWAGLLQGAMVSSPDVKGKFGLPQGHTHHYPMMVGFPKSRYYRMPERKTPTIHWQG